MAKIDRVEIHEYAYEVEGLGRDRNWNLVSEVGAKTRMTNFVVVIRSDDGARGEYAAMFGGKRAQLGQVLMLPFFLLGRDPDHREAIWDDMKRAQRQFAFLGVGMMDICLWDLAAKRMGVSISRMLGGYRDRLPTYASTMNGHRGAGRGLTSKEAYGDFALQCKALGYPGFKIHGWTEGNPKEEAENVLHVRKAVGDDMALMIDPSCELRTFADALYVGRACDEAGYFWYEDPFRDGGISQHAHRKLRQMLKTPLLQTEQVRGLEPKADWLASESTDFVRSDPELDLGITGCMKTAHLAEAFGLDLEIHAAGPAHRHCMGAIRNTNFYELTLVAPGVRNPIPTDVFACGYTDQLEAVESDGCFTVPTGPGLGVTLDWQYIERHRTQLHEFKL
jgi:L-alanine-DL-glutamate epimerase-like enolase superfamily enzyme